MAAEYLANAVQEVNLNAPINFTASIPCTKGWVYHEDETGIFILRGMTNQCFATYQVTYNGNIAIPEEGEVTPIAVALTVNGEKLLENIRNIQIPQQLKPSETVDPTDLRLTIEMETGTGKTYTYIKTMFELNKLYGWSKFIIVVPSIAIREGVSRSFEIMSEHFAAEYGKRIQSFIYDSKQLTKIDQFASDSNMHVMIINTQVTTITYKKVEFIILNF